MNPRTTKRIARIIAIITIVALVVTSATFLGSMYWGASSYGASPGAEDKAYLDERLEMLKDDIMTVESQYKDDVDYETLIDGAYEGVVDILGDPYSSYYADQGDSDDFVTDVLGVFSGVGLSLEEYDGRIRVVAALPETPAGRAGIMTGDIIKSINGVSVSGKSMNDVILLIRGEEGSRVDIVFDRAGAEIPCNLVRETIHIASVGGELLEGGIGYIRIASFDDDSDEEFGRIKAELVEAGATSLILDVRNNPGGLIGTVVSLAEQIMPDSPITYFRQKGNLIGVQRASGRNYTEMPMVLLINGGSASGSEILAGALKDSGVATLVGTETYGKGVGQTIFDIPGNGSLKLSTFYFETPDKNKVDKVGISPDYYVPMPAVLTPSEELTSRYASFAPMSEKAKPAFGDTGLNVFGAQQRLAFLGYDVNITGTVDEVTAEAVKRFQTSFGGYSNGILDYGTMENLDKECVKLAAGVAGDEDPQLEKAIELLRGGKVK
jgi:carboxyl-terminal processing protease